MSSLRVTCPVMRQDAPRIEEIMGGVNRYQVVVLVDPSEPTLPRWYECHCEGKATWPSVWRVRDQWPGKLGVWFRELAAAGREPQEVVLLTGIDGRTAGRLVSFLIRETVRMAGGEPPWLCNMLLRNVGGVGRPISVITTDGVVETFPSVAALARRDGVDRSARAHWPMIDRERRSP